MNVSFYARLFGIQGEKGNRGGSAFQSDGTDKGINRRDSQGDGSKNSEKRTAKVAIDFTIYVLKDVFK